MVAAARSRLGSSLLTAVVTALAAPACALLVGIEDVVVVEDEDGEEGGSSGKIPASKDGGACLEATRPEKCASGEFSGFLTGTPCLDTCQCQRDTFCIKQPGSATGMCGHAGACGSLCKGDWDCLSLVCEDSACQ